MNIRVLASTDGKQRYGTKFTVRLYVITHREKHVIIATGKVYDTRAGFEPKSLVQRSIRFTTPSSARAHALSLIAEKTAEGFEPVPASRRPTIKITDRRQFIYVDSTESVGFAKTRQGRT
jgi:predicted DNA-binding WGR domain protein